MTEKIDPEHQEEIHVVKPSLYGVILIILLLLTGLTAGVSFIDLGVFNAVIALAIACLKASLVILFFMHIRYSSRVLKMTLGSGLFAFGLMLALTLSDYITRAWGRW